MSFLTGAIGRWEFIRGMITSTSFLAIAVALFLRFESLFLVQGLGGTLFFTGLCLLILIYQISLCVRRNADLGDDTKHVLLLLVPVVNLFVFMAFAFRPGVVLRAHPSTHVSLYDDHDPIVDNGIFTLATLAFALTFAFLYFDGNPYEHHENLVAGATDPVSLTKVESRTLSLLERNVAKKCDRTVNLLAEKLVHLRMDDKVVQVIDRYRRRCRSDNPELQHYRFTALKRLGNWSEAVVEATTIIKGSPHNENYYVWRGQIFETSGRFSEAIRDYKSAMRIQPDITTIPLHVASLYEKLDKQCSAYKAVRFYRRHHRELRHSIKIHFKAQSLKSACKAQRRLRKLSIGV